jgi:hypothetical protein
MKDEAKTDEARSQVLREIWRVIVVRTGLWRARVMAIIVESLG